MRSGASTILMEFGGGQIGAIRVEGRGASARVSGWTLAPSPEGEASKDPTQLGARLKQQLSDAGLDAGQVVIGVPRSEVVLKLLSVPGGASLDEHELSSVVRLQMARQTAVAIEDAAFDYDPFDAAEGATDRHVLVGAIPGARLDWRRRVLESAGLKLGALRLRAAGIGQLVSASAEGGDAPALGIAIGPDSAEYALVEHGRLVFARTADLPDQSEDRELLARRIAVEAKRTAMSFRVAQRTPDVGAVVVLGGDTLAELTARQCSDVLGVPSVTYMPEIAGIDDVPQDMARALAPLIGLAIQEELGRPGLDFANPRKGPDRLGSARRGVLAAVLGLVLVLGAGYVVRSSVLAPLRTDLEGARSRASTLRGEYLDAMATDARAEHLDAWIQAGPGWGEELEGLAKLLPLPDRGALDAITLSSDPEVSFEGGAATPYPGAWRIAANARIGLEGQAKSREVSTSLRERVIEDGRYEMSVRGPDVSDRYSLELRPRGGRDE